MRTTSRRPRSGAVAALLGLVLSALFAAGFASPATASSPVQDAPYDLPHFRSTGAVVDPFDDSLPWNPTHEFIFPTVFHAGKHLEHPLAEWYIYFAPHDAPGGINLMYSDSLEGPWTQFQGNPLISNDWTPNYDVSHVSSPDVVWNPADRKMYLFFHGENTVTRYATSADGLHFNYGDSVVTTAMVDAAQSTDLRATETSYARVFPNPDRSSSEKWGMFFMTNYSDDHRRINVAFSKDLKTWRVGDHPVVEPGDAEGGNVSAADLWRWKGKNYIVYHGSTGSILVRSIADDLMTTGPAQPLFIPQPAPPQNGRAASAQIVKDKGVVHMFYEYGDRSHTTIGHAVQDDSAPLDPLNTHPEDPVWAQCSGAGSDEFDGTSLDTSLWSSSVRMDQSRATVSDGLLRMPTYAGNSTTTPIVLQPLGDRSTWEVTTKLTLDPTQNYQQAGLIARRDDANSLRLDVAHAAYGQRIDFVYRSNGKDRIANLTDFELVPSDFDGTIYLRMTNDGEWITASSSVDGQTFQTVGRAAPTTELGATDIGPFAYRGSSTTPEIEADFDWVRFAPTPEEQTACG